MKINQLLFLIAMLTPGVFAQKIVNAPNKLTVIHIEGEKKKVLAKASGSTVAAVVTAMPEAKKEKPEKGPTKYEGENLICDQVEGLAAAPVVNTTCKFEVDEKGHVSKPGPDSDKNVFTTLPTQAEISPKIAVTKVKDDSEVAQLTISTANGGTALTIAKSFASAPSDPGPQRNQSTLKGEQIWCIFTRNIAPNERLPEFKLTPEEITKMDADSGVAEVACSFVFDKKGNVSAPKSIPKI